MFREYAHYCSVYNEDGKRWLWKTTHKVWRYGPEKEKPK